MAPRDSLGWGSLVPLLLLPLSRIPVWRAQETEAVGDPRVRGLFSEHCASCHGETGDGKGTAELDRPARSFRDGGFSYGNTPAAIFRTLTFGIPGTPMPAFDASLSEDQRRLLAGHVVALGPPGTKVDPADTVLEVGARPRIVRGLLPPIAPGAREHPRGLLIGTPSGLTFEYRTDDVRMIGVRQGSFCERTDWLGRGGTLVQPLGQVVYVVEGGDPRPLFSRAGDPLKGRLLSSWIRDTRAGLRYVLADAEGRVRADLRESVRAVGAPFGAGFSRRFEILGAPPREVLELRLVAQGDGELLEIVETPGRTARRWAIVRRTDGFHELRGFPAGLELVGGVETGRLDLRLAAGPKEPLVVDLITLVAPEWGEVERNGLDMVNGQ